MGRLPVGVDHHCYVLLTYAVIPNEVRDLHFCVLSANYTPTPKMI